MAHLTRSVVFVILFVTVFQYLPSLDARNILHAPTSREVPNWENNGAVSAADPKGPSPPYSTGENCHAIAINGRLFASVDRKDRILQTAIPSPGIGHH
ncbi:hypothetical protein CJ030_MR4G002248 [Morella rubra]|uniref:Uncharacterized protein n=1 Tax=Morella rubra TaxID=262757 RepID=A0A6A1VU52_9ROSI|nr:hypothetical protein CJ030_MR4G002248 [Morella rubra]